jgi:hypothetical protein
VKGDERVRVRFKPHLSKLGGGAGVLLEKGGNLLHDGSSMNYSLMNSLGEERRGANSWRKYQCGLGVTRFPFSFQYQGSVVTDFGMFSSDSIDNSKRCLS